MADNIKISIELADKAAQKALSQFIDKANQADKSLEGIGKSGKDAFGGMSLSMGKAIDAFDVFKANIATGIVTGAFNLMQSAASSLFNTFVVDGIKAASEQQVAMNDLNTALILSGQYSKQASEEMRAYANSMQSTTTIQDDAILSTAALIQNLGQLDKEGLKKATSAAADLSAALGIDLRTAATLVGKAAAGEVGTFSRYGLVIEKGASQAETFNNALNKINASFGGAAQSKVLTYSGAMQQLTNAFGEIPEAVGNVFVENSALIGVMNQLSSIFLDTSKGVDGNVDSMKKLVAEGLIITIDTVNALIQELDVLLRTGSAVFNGLATAFDGTALLLAKTFNLVGAASDETVNEIEKGWKESMAAVNKAIFEESGLSSLSGNLTDLSTAAKIGLAEIGTAADSTSTQMGNASTSVRELTEEQKKHNQELVTFAQGLEKKGEDTGLFYQNQLALLQEYKTLEQTIETDADSVNYELKLERTKFFHEAQLQLLQEQNDAELVKLEEARANKLISEKTFNAAKLELQNQHNTQSLKLESKKVQDDMRLIKEREKQERQYNQNKVQATADVFGAIGSIASLGGKRMFEVAKAFNLAEAITAGILSVQKAAASAPPPFNTPAIVSASVMSVANVARIASTQAPSFADGGIVPGNSFYGDRVQANVNSGEMVLNKQQQRNLFELANSPNGGSTDALLIELINVVRSASQTSINIDGREIINVVRDGLNSGRALT
jgi:hypothetical protein